MGQVRKEREAHWRGVLKRQSESGLGVGEFCRQESISVPSFYSWRRRLQESEVTGNQEADRSSTGVSSRQLLPVHIASAAPAVAVRILLPQGVSLETSTGVDDRRLTDLLRALREASGC